MPKNTHRARKELANIETVVRQQWCEEGSKFRAWLLVDRRQALDLIEMIPSRLPVFPEALPPVR